MAERGHKRGVKEMAERAHIEMRKRWDRDRRKMVLRYGREGDRE
jgi:hypothetical protein